MRRKQNLDSRLESCANLLVAEPEKKRGFWLSEYEYNDLFIELGCGKGRFTVDTAKTKPDTLFVALEKISNVLVMAMERTYREELQNIRYINKLADDLTSFFSYGEVSRIYINFCDPWPSRRHEKRRLTGQKFLALYKQILRPNGDIHFKTDNLLLFEYSLNEFEKNGFLLSDVSYDLHKDKNTGIMTDYEKKFHDTGMPIYRCVALNRQ